MNKRIYILHNIIIIYCCYHLIQNHHISKKAKNFVSNPLVNYLYLSTEKLIFLGLDKKKKEIKNKK